MGLMSAIAREADFPDRGAQARLDGAQARLDAIQARLADGTQLTKLHPDTLAALETVSVDFTGEGTLASEATLEALRALVAAEDFASETTLDAARVLLDQVRTTLVSNESARDADAAAAQARLDLLASETKLEQVRAVLAGTLRVRDHHDIIADDGLMFAAGGEATTSAVSPNASLSIRNPTGSGKNVVLHGYSVYADANATVRYYLQGTNTGTVRAPVNYRVGSPNVSIAECRVGPGVFNTAGSTELSIMSRVGPNAPLTIEDIHFTLPPGQMFTVRFIGPGATNLVVLNAKWYEELV